MRKIVLGIIGFVMFLFIVSCLFGSFSDSGTTVVVESEGSYSGSIGGISDGGRTIEGSGNQNFTVNDTFASACIQKGISNHGDLTVKIVRGGQVVKEQTTSADYGVVTISG